MFKKLWKWLYRCLLVIWLLVVFLVGAKLAQNNAQPVNVDLVFWQFPEVTSGVLMCVSFFLGVTLGVFAIAPVVILVKARLKRLQNK